MVISAIRIYIYVLLKYNACKGTSVVTFPIIFSIYVRHQTASSIGNIAVGIYFSGYIYVMYMYVCIIMFDLPICIDCYLLFLLGLNSTKGSLSKRDKGNTKMRLNIF